MVMEVEQAAGTEGCLEDIIEATRFLPESQGRVLHAGGIEVSS